jgi:hypothetical protein
MPKFNEAYVNSFLGCFPGQLDGSEMRGAIFSLGNAYLDS